MEGVNNSRVHGLTWFFSVCSRLFVHLAFCLTTDGSSDCEQYPLHFMLASNLHPPYVSVQKLLDREERRVIVKTIEDTNDHSRTKRTREALDDG